MGGVGRGLVPLLLVVVAMPVGLAEPVQGHLHTRDPVWLPGGALEGPLYAAYLNDTRGLEGLHLVTPRLVVHRFEKDFVNVNSGPIILRPSLALRSSSYEVHDVRVRLYDSGNGWLGLAATSLSTSSHLNSSTPYSVAPREAARIGNWEGPGAEAPPTMSAYGHFVARPHLYTETPGHLRIAGAGSLKFQGPTVDIESRENSTRVSTSRNPTGDPLSTSTESWVILEWQEGELKADSSHPVQMATGTSRLSWDGPATIRVAAGELQSPTATYAPSSQGGSITLVGPFQATSTPTVVNNAPSAVLAVAGDLVSTNLHAQALAQPRMPLQPTIPWAPIFASAVAATLLLIGVGYVIGKSRARRQQSNGETVALTVEDFGATYNDEREAGLAEYRLARIAAFHNPKKSLQALRRALLKNPGLAQRAAADPSFARLREPDVVEAYIRLIERSDPPTEDSGVRP